MKVSILLITFNHALYIEEAIKSILMQKHEYETEIILLDDCSTDKTLSIARELLLNRNNVQVISNELNLGITKNYQKGFSLCSGEYVFILEGDDYWLDTYKVEKQVQFLERYPFHSMCFHPFIIQKGMKRIFEPFVLSGEVPPALAKYKIPPGESVSFFSISDLITVEGLIGTFSVCCYRKKWLDQLPSALFEVTAYDWAVNLFMAHFGLLGRINLTMSVYRYADKATWSTKTDLERLKDTKHLIPVYDKLLDFQYSQQFNEKLAQIDGSIHHLEDQAKATSENRFHNWMPPIIKTVFKQLMPPALKKINKP